MLVVVAVMTIVKIGVAPYNANVDPRAPPIAPAAPEIPTLTQLISFVQGFTKA